MPAVSSKGSRTALALCFLDIADGIDVSGERGSILMWCYPSYRCNGIAQTIDFKENFSGNTIYIFNNEKCYNVSGCNAVESKSCRFSDVMR